jgi:DNA-binding GntR family transcriptional regulator
MAAEVLSLSLGHPIQIKGKSPVLNLLPPEGRYFTSKTDYVAECLRTAILLNSIPSGTRITEKQLKDLLRVSSTPIREALHVLEAEGLLTRRPHGGTKVTETNIGDAKELYSIQSLLQAMAVQISTKKLQEKDIDDAERLNNEMHDIVFGKIDVNKLRILNYKFHLTVCGMNVYPWLTRVISSLWIRFPSQSIWTVKNASRTILREHVDILKAIKQRDESRAGSRMRKHMETSMKILLDKCW